MLKKQMIQYLDKVITDNKVNNPIPDKIILELYKEEIEYIEKYQLLSDDLKTSVEIKEKPSLTRFDDVYMERCDKETEELLAEESAHFLDQPISYFQTHIDEFLYLESNWFDLVGVDGISFEVNSVFHTYDILLGIKLPKKTEATIRSFVSSKVNNDGKTLELMFNANEGIWDFNFTLNHLKDFQTEWTIREAYMAAYQLLFELAEFVETELKMNK